MLCVRDSSTAIGAACPVIQCIMIPGSVGSMGKGFLAAANGTNLLMHTVINVCSASECMNIGCWDFFCGLCFTHRANQLLASIFNTGGFFCDFANFPIMTVYFYISAFSATAGMFVVFSGLPTSKTMFTCLLNTSSTAAVGGSDTCIVSFTALGTALVHLMWMSCFEAAGIAVTTTAGRGTAAGIVGRTEIEVADLSSANQNAGALRTDIAGVAFNCVKICTFGVIDKTHMRKALFEEKVTLLRCVVAAALIGKTKIIGICNTGSFQNTCGNSRLSSTPADKHTAPR